MIPPVSPVSPEDSSNSDKQLILEQVPELVRQLQSQELALLSAEPGAGKTTRLPIALMQHPAFQGGKIIMTAPRRVAAQAAATYMAGLIGEYVGERIGYRVKQDQKISAQTRLELVTSGVLLRMLQTDPTLEGVSLVILDEFHERTVESDLILALCRQMNLLYRDENPTGLLVMSATLAQEALEAALKVPILFCEGRTYPLEYHYSRTSFALSDRVDATIATCLEILENQDGDLLCFLPGVGEINRVYQALSQPCLNAKVDLRQLHGQQKLAEQQAAIAPSDNGQRRCILATAIAETSLTIEGITLVVDSGLAREARFDKEAGVVRLHTRSVTRAEAKQRAGRAGRTQAGSVFRCWSQDQQSTLASQPEPEINRQDLSELALQLVQWGSDNPDEFDWVTPPPKARWQSALKRLEQLDLISRPASPGLNTHAGAYQLTDHGALCRHLVLSAHLARGWLALLKGSSDAPLSDSLTTSPNSHLAVNRPTIEALQACAFVFSLLQEGAHLPENDLFAACEQLINAKDSASKALTQRINLGAQRLLRDSQRLNLIKTKETGYKNSLPSSTSSSSNRENSAHGNTAKSLLSQLADAKFLQSLKASLCLAYADKIGLKATKSSKTTGQTDDQAGIYKLSNGRQAQLKSHQKPLFLIALHARSFSQDSRETLTLWLELDKNTVKNQLMDKIQQQPFCHWQDDRLINSVQTRLGDLVLDEKQGEKPDDSALIQAGCQRVKAQGLSCLPWQDSDKQLRQRLQFLHQNNKKETWPDFSDPALLASVNDWLAPFLNGVKNQKLWQQLPMSQLLKSRLSWNQQQALNQLVPSHIKVASGRQVAIDYNQNPPVVSTKLQEMFGTETVPDIAGVAVSIHLLSPAGRPLAVTSNLGTFWREVYPEVRKEMRGRYPKHPWPEDPLTAEATHKTKRHLAR